MSSAAALGLALLGGVAATLRGGAWPAALLGLTGALCWLAGLSARPASPGRLRRLGEALAAASSALLVAALAGAWTLWRVPEVPEAPTWRYFRAEATLEAGLGGDRWRLRLERVHFPRRAERVPLRVLARLPRGGSPAPRPGDRVEVAGRLSPFRPPANPGDPDFSRAWRLMGLSGEAGLERVSPRPGAPWDRGCAVERAAAAWRERLAARLSAGLPAEQGALFASLLLGEAAAPVPDAQREAFRAAGLAHALAASGAQLALLGGLAWGLARVLGLPAIAQWLVAAGACGGYYALTGMPPSMGRATCMALVAFAGLCFGRPLRPYVGYWLGLSLAALAYPPWVETIGFHLSALATYGLVRLARRLRARPPLGRWRILLLALVGPSFAASLWVAPYQWYRFGEWATYGLAANVLAGPLIEGLTLWGLVVSAAGALHPAIAPLLNRVSGWGLAALTALVERVAELPGAVLHGPTGNAGACAAAMLALLAGRRRPLLALGLGGLAAFGLLRAASPPGKLTLAVLAVGQGDAIALRLPDGAAIVVDGGPPGNGALRRQLSRWGQPPLALVVASHPHLDHVGGLAGLPAERVWDAGGTSPSEAYRLLLADWLGRGVPFGRPGGLFRRAGVEVHALGLPPPGSAENAANLALEVRYGRFRAWLMGDAEAADEEALAAPERPLDVLKVSHHGSRTASSALFLARVKPAWAVVSVGERNAYGHPHPEVLARLTRRAGHVWRTDRQGGFSIESDGRERTLPASPGAPRGLGSSHSQLRRN